MTNVERFLSMDEHQKARAFDRVALQYFNKNFGRFSKGDMDVLMFSILVNQFVDRQLSDYQIAQQLGITEARVRSFRIKTHLIYGEEREGWWRKQFCGAISDARYDDGIHKVVMPILDPNVKRELEAYIDSKHWYSEYQLNPKLLIMRPDQFVELYVSLAKEDGSKFDPRKTAQKITRELAGNPASAKFDEASFLATWKNQGSGVAIKNIVKNIPGLAVKTIFSAIVAGMTGGIPGGNVIVNSDTWIKALSDFIERIE